MERIITNNVKCDMLITTLLRIYDEQFKWKLQLNELKNNIKSIAIIAQDKW